MPPTRDLPPSSLESFEEKTQGMCPFLHCPPPGGAGSLVWHHLFGWTAPSCPVVTVITVCLPPPSTRLLPRSSFKPSFCITTLSLSGKQQHPAPLAAWSRHGEVMCGVLRRTPCTATAGPGSTRACFCVTVEIVSKKPPAFDGKLLVDVLLPVLCGDREDYYSDLWMQGWGPWMWVHGWMVASCPPSQ